ncbi:MAG: SIS domain-containing protein [Dermatophilaceae bacterium]
MPALDEALLDDEGALAALDSRGALRALATAGAQVRQAVDLCADAGVARLAGTDRPRSVLVAALGGSAVVADVLGLLAEPGSPVPVNSRQGMPLPGWVGALDLVVAVSHSGRAPGPLALAAEAARRGASLLTVGAPDSPLADVCARARGIQVDVPADRTSTRTALWSLLAPVVCAADAMGLVEAGPDVLARVADRLDAAAEALRPSSEAFVNPAKSLALDLAGGIPVVLGDGPLGGVAARRVAAMLARTARLPVMAGELPDTAFDVVALFDGPYTQAWADARRGRADGLDELFRDPYLDGEPDPRLRLLALRDADAGEATDAARAELAEAVAATAREAGVRVIEHTAQPGHPLERWADLVSLGDFAATYLALGLRLDPGVSPHLADLRDRTR